MNDEEKPERIKDDVRKSYARIAKGIQTSCCGPKQSCCSKRILAQDISKKIGYTNDELSCLPEGANLGLGCGNPVALASLNHGEVVLDLGSGAGIDCFLAARQVGPTGKVIGLDMTAEMVAKARDNARKGGFENIEFRLGDIENMPVEKDSVDVIISNCVINLVPDKTRAFAETYRVLKAGGRMMISDIVLTKELPVAIKESVEAYVGCLSGAVMKEEYLRLIKKAGFQEVQIQSEQPFPLDVMGNDPAANAIVETPKVSQSDLELAENAVISIKVSALK
ncbi:MAG: arsenite methyltransferase [Sedimentisphaerales bacterium]|nr:arsenite methyltransferase [Sedimentisphaerales bacterium]